MMPKKKHREDVRNSIVRMIIVGLSVCLQITWFALVVLRLNENYLVISLITRLVTILVVLGIFGKHTAPDIKLSWILFIMALPILGLTFYLLSNRSNFIKTMRRKFERIDRKIKAAFPDDTEVFCELRQENPEVANQMYFLKHSCGFPVYHNTDVVYYKEAIDAIIAQIDALKKAEKFIFMEYHAIEDRQAFQQIKDVLIERARAGVEVRLFYDDVGSVGFINPQFIKEMRQNGVECRVFNPLIPVVNLFMNNRDHRKITVIDGKVGFTGGYNLANEYFNVTHPYGYWKDTGIRLSGDAVRTLTLLFLEMWNAIEETDHDLSRFLPEFPYQARNSGYCVPFGDSPLDEIHTGEDVYMNMIRSAKGYVYIATPYLILTDGMIRELSMAARRGVDVRIVTPGIPDKKIVYGITRSFYNALVRTGVRIYEYTPGFIHAKMTLVDDELCTIGTINYDYRSFYHHFENAVLLYHYPCLRHVKEDFQEIFNGSCEVTDKYAGKRPTSMRIWQCILRLFAPLL